MTNHINPLECRECSGQMKPGTAMTNHLILAHSLTDFPGAGKQERGQTVTVIPGEPFLVPVLKCQDCGHSFIPIDKFTASEESLYSGDLSPSDADAELRQDVILDKQNIENALDDFCVTLVERMKKKYDQGYRGWDEGYPTSKLMNELLQDAADLRNSSKTENSIRQLATDIANRAMMIWFRSMRVSSRKNSS